MAESEQFDLSEIEGLEKSQILALDILASGGTLKDISGLDDDDIEALYAIGYNFYKQGKYDEAESMFQYICLYAHLEPRFWMALGNCRQMQKNHQKAIDAYGFSYMIEQDDPWPPIQAAVCYLALGNKELAKDSLELAEMSIEPGSDEDGEAARRIAALREGL